MSFSTSQNEDDEKSNHEENTNDVGCKIIEYNYNDVSDCDDTDNDVYKKIQMHNVMHQQIFIDEDEMNDTTCNMISSKNDALVLRRPTKEEIDQIIANMVAQVYTHGMISKFDVGRVAGIFVKKIDLKGENVNKPKEGHNIKVKNVSKK